MKKNLLAIVGAALAATLACGAASAADWPQKPVRVIVPYAAGSTPDGIARLIFDRVQKRVGQPMVIENRPGAAGMIGADAVAKSAPDGHTLLLAPSGPLVTNALLYKKMSYDPVKDLAPVALVAETPSILVASNATAARDAKELVAAMADRNQKLAYASPGNGTLGHLSMAYLVATSGGEVPHAAYPGSPQIVTALIANDVQMASLPPLAVAPFVQSGRIKAIAVVGPRRSQALPGVPTLKEQGIDFEPVGWFGVATRGGTPAQTVEHIHAAIAEALKDPELARAYAAQGLEVVDRGPADFAAYMRRELAQWKPVIERNRIVLE
ncbi:tripartite tricarboxylate transporter substrate binding protein [Variovorax sp. KK3]|uniref:Bug family tripartite tricarboxylate transporter substrate binding protein n=1 Tax=Variovorax sp. KK3 TaxID=1855728 RepID=UPI00097C002D|nr:tripartite tricarboxylate transporter substrate binding protein [Variovorax sp. KK3]